MLFIFSKICRNNQAFATNNLLGSREWNVYIIKIFQ